MSELIKDARTCYISDKKLIHALTDRVEGLEDALRDLVGHNLPNSYQDEHDEICDCPYCHELSYALSYALSYTPHKESCESRGVVKVKRRRLVNEPIHQMQPDESSCVLTCIAMALGLDVLTVLRDVRDLGLGWKNGTDYQQMAYILGEYGVGCVPIQVEGTGIIAGSYICNVASLNRLGQSHAIFMHRDEQGGIRIFDPQNGRHDRAYYSMFEETPMTGLARLDDYFDLLLGDER